MHVLRNFRVFRPCVAHLDSWSIFVSSAGSRGSVFVPPGRRLRSAEATAAAAAAAAGDAVGLRGDD